MQRYSRGSEWRKWDLHVHAPGAKLADGYGTSPPWDEYCQIIEQSDVTVIGITDYFSLDSYFQFLDEHHSRYPESKKVFFANLELRLNETVNKAQEEVHIHLLFRPGIDRQIIARLLEHLPVQHHEDTGRQRACSELETGEDYASATVTREHIKAAIAAAFGDPEHADEQVLVLVPANNDGIRPTESKRKRQLADEIERDCHALFGAPGNMKHFLDPDRYEVDISAPPKPVFAGSDAHTLTELANWLGKSVDTPGQQKHTTWIKADPTFEGLTQTLVEPAERVRIQASKPDHKEPYKIIDRVRFTGTDEFPAEIVFNQNLVSIIGSRSSGKSALLAYIAHAINPDATIAEQQAVAPSEKREKLGPAAGKSWAAVSHIHCEVDWAAPSEHTGQVIYIPQNSLHAISQRPAEITEKIAPAVHRLDPEFRLAHEKTSGEIQDANRRIAEAVSRWFELTTTVTNAERQLREIGDKEAIDQTRQQLQERIAKLQEASSLTEQETTAYQQLIARLQEIQARLAVIDADAVKLDTFLVSETVGEETPGEVGQAATYRLGGNVRVNVSLTPDISSLPEPAQTQARELLDQTKRELTTSLQALIAEQRASLARERAALTGEEATLREENKALIEKNAANSEIETLVKERQTQDQALAQIAREQVEIKQLADSRAEQIKTIAEEIERREGARRTLAETFDQREHTLDEMRFGLEQAHDGKQLAALAARFNQRQIGPFIDRGEGKHLLIEKAQQKPGELLKALQDGTQSIMKGQGPQQLAADVLTTTKENRFLASMEGDRIGGFYESSMTPGKQALFALTLILNESDHAWPLLIDQPEDDLDSRSVYDVLVRYMIERKKGRQIVMVSHNANLVIGADSEQIVVANRHGADRQNENEQQFDYLTGSLEYSKGKTTTEFVLASCGIREHACELLDGGEEAFRKRKAKYKL